MMRCVAAILRYVTFVFKHIHAVVDNLSHSFDAHVTDVIAIKHGIL